MKNLTDHGIEQSRRLAMHLGLMAVLLQRGAPLTLIQTQCLHLRTMLAEIIALDEAPDAYVQVTQLIDDTLAELLAEGNQVPDDLSSLDDGIDPRDSQ